MIKKKKKINPKTYKFDTLSLHAGYQPHKNAGSRQVPIYQTTSYIFDDVDHAAALFNLERGGHIYSRISNPTVGFEILLYMWPPLSRLKSAAAWSTSSKIYDVV